jgi:predicted nuclease of predicted toxin-antitoxin system
LILLCDEDVGTGIPKALNLVGYETRYLRGLGLAGKPDTVWLAIAGQNEWLVFSYNKKMLKVPSERDTIIREKVGIVFLTNGTEHIAAVLRLLLSKWNVLELLWDAVERPFARFLSPNGRMSDKYRDYQLDKQTI